MQSNHQQHSAAQQHNKQPPRYMQAQQQQQQQQQVYGQQQQRYPPRGSAGNIPRQQQHPGVGQVPQQQQQPQVVVSAQQIPQQTRVPQPQVTPPQYAYPTGPIQIVQYNPTNQGIAPQYRAVQAFPAGVPTTAYYSAPVAYNHIQQWQLAQTQQQVQQAQIAAAQQFYQHQQQQGVQTVHQIIQQPGVQQFYVRGLPTQPQPTFVQGAPLQPTPPPQVQPQQTHHQPHVQQHPQQSHGGVQNVGIMQVQSQPEVRENVQPPHERRKKNMLQIVDPSTGKSVFDSSEVVTPPSTAAVTDSETTQAVTVSNNEEPATVSLNSASAPNLVSTPQVSPGDSESVNAKPVEEKSGARSEFYLKISQLGDEGASPPGRGNGETTAQQQQSSTATSSTPTGVITPPSASPVPASGSEEQEGTQEIDSGTAQIVENETNEKSEEPSIVAPVSTASFNGTSDSVQEASLCSISPTPIEKYLPKTEQDSPTPTSPVQLTEKIEPTSEEPSVPEKQELSTPEVISPHPDETEAKSVSTENNKLDNEVVEVEIEKSTEETKTLTAITTDENKTLATETLQNGSAELPEPEQNNDGENEDEEGELSLEEGEVTESEDATTPSSGAKQRIIYNRDQLLAFKLSKESLDIQIPADLVKDPRSSNAANIGNYNFKQGGSPGGMQHMGGRGGPPMRGGRDNRMGMGMGGPGRQMGMPGGGWMGGMGMGAGPFQVPPPFQPPKSQAPKVIEREQVKLHKDPSPWKPTPVGKGKGGEDDVKDEEEIIQEDVVKKTRGILNKLTPENFDKLVSKFMQLRLEDKDERIGKVIHVVFEKAVDEPSFSTAYANMVKTVCDKSPDTAKKFRKQILDQCQKEFQKGNTDEEEIKKLEEDLAAAEDGKKEIIKLEIEEKRFMLRRRALGNVRFIGELYKLHMLTPKIMLECINMLLATQDEENYECLCKLLTTVGQKLEEQLAEAEGRAQESMKRGMTPKFMPEPKYMEKTFATLKSLSNNLKLSSRIRFALLDVFELRQNGWKPRRDAAGPKTIDEVRRDAIRQEQEEKRQLQNLAPAPPPVSRYGQPPPPKKGDWNTVTSSNKSSRFAQMKKPVGSEPSNVTLGPPQGGSLWNRGPMNQGPPSKPPSNLPPRLMQNNKYAALSSEAPPRTPYRHEIVHPPPPPIRTPPSIGSSSRESSRPQTPTREYGLPPPKDEPEELPLELSAKDREVVKNILEEFASFRRWEDTLDWIQGRFKGQRVYSFIEEVSRLVSEMSKEDQQKAAGSLINSLIKKGLVNKVEVIKKLKDGVIADLPDIEVDVPKATSYLAVFLVELFLDESDLVWLLEFEDKFEDYPESWTNLTSNTLNILKLRRSEEAVQTLFKQTNGADRFPVEDIPWIKGDTLESLTEKFIQVLKKEIPKQSDPFHVCMETFDLRSELTNKSLIQALCTICWKEEEHEWDIPSFERNLMQIRMPSNTDHLPLLWKQAQEFISSKNIDKSNENKLWSLMIKLNLIDNSHRDNHP